MSTASSKSFEQATAPAAADGGRVPPIEVRLQRPPASWLVILPGGLFACVMLTLGCKLVGLHCGLWAVPALFPSMIWIALCRRRHMLLLPGVIAGVHGRRRGALTVGLAVALQLIWPSWARTAEAAWRTGHAGISTAHGLSLPYGSVLAAAPATLAVLACLLLMFLMVIAPRKTRRRFNMPPATQPVRYPASPSASTDEWEAPR